MLLLLWRFFHSLINVLTLLGFIKGFLLDELLLLLLNYLLEPIPRVLLLLYDGLSFGGNGGFADCLLLFLDNAVEL